MTNKENDFYINLRARMRKWLNSKQGAASEWAEFLMLAPDLFHLIWRLSVDPNIAAGEKTKLLLATGYFISPIDLIPEALLGPIGFTDDIALTAYVLNGLINKTDIEILRKYWAGDEDILIVIKNILGTAEKMVGSGIWKKLRNKIG